MNNNRLRRLRERLQEKELDAMLVSTPENRRYLSGFSGSAGYLLISEEDAILGTDFRYVEQAGRQAPDFRVQRIAATLAWFPELAAELGVKRVGFESQNMTVAAHSAFTKAVEESETSNRPELVATTEVVDQLRALKDEEEMEMLSKAVEIADEAFEQVAPTVEPGVAERDVAWELEKAMRDLGADSVSFDIIVGAGPNGALPHHRAGDKVIQKWRGRGHRHGRQVSGIL